MSTAPLHPRRLNFYVTVLAALGLILLVSHSGPGEFVGFLAMAPAASLLTLYGEWRAPYIPGFGALNFAEAVYFAVALEQGPAQAALLGAGVGLAGDFLRRKSAPVKVFNLGWALTTFVSVGAVARWAGYQGMTSLKSLPAVLCCGATYFVVAGGLQAIAQVFLENLPLRRTVALQFGLMRYSLASALCLGCACAVLLRSSPWLTLVLVFPIEMLSGFLEKDQLNKALLATQAALVQAEKQAALGVMAAGVAHELNSPLAAIMVNIHMLRDPLLPPDLREHCARLVERSTIRARDIVSALLDVSRPPAVGQGDPQVALRDAVAALGLDIQGDLRGLPLVALQTGPLTQVFSNLLQNAALACQPNPRGPILVRGVVHGSNVRMEVEDAGTGIAADHLPRIWDPFFTTRAVGSGTGLGLWLCRNLVEGVGGCIEVSKTGPEGTIFTLTLPKATP